MQVGGLARADLEYIHRERGIQTPNRQGAYAVRLSSHASIVFLSKSFAYSASCLRCPEEVLRNAFFVHCGR